jgi:hypothetical protein
MELDGNQLIAYGVADESDPAVYPRAWLDNVDNPLFYLHAINSLLLNEMQADK